jgi:alkyl hydroperoxide reductase subunit AhpC
MSAFELDRGKFADLDAQVVGISVDSLYCHMAWQRHDIGLLSYPLASDFYPHGAVAEKFGVLRSGDPIPGINDRAVFIIDKQGKIAFVKLYALDRQPDNQELMDALQKMG